MLWPSSFGLPTWLLASVYDGSRPRWLALCATTSHGAAGQSLPAAACQYLALISPSTWTEPARFTLCCPDRPWFSPRTCLSHRMLRDRRQLMSTKALVSKNLPSCFASSGAQLLALCGGFLPLWASSLHLHFGSGGCLPQGVVFCAPSADPLVPLSPSCLSSNAFPVGIRAFEAFDVAALNI